MSDLGKLQELSKLVRYYILTMTTKAGSGHPTSSMSAADLMVALYFGGKLKFDLKNPKNLNNDRVIFSKGHASPLFYALYRVARVLTDRDLDGYRTMGSKLEGHPRPNFPYAEAATGSLGQGLSIGLGMAMAAKADEIPNTTYVLLGDSEMAEGSVWEAIEIASYYQVDNLVGIVDVNRLGQRGATMLGWEIDKYRARAEAFGWEVHEVDGHDTEAILQVLDNLPVASGRPQMILARTIKGKGVPFLENKDGWHGKALNQEELKEALFALGEVNKGLKGEVTGPEGKARLLAFSSTRAKPGFLPGYKVGEMVATRKAFGEVLAQLGQTDNRIVSLDGEVKNSTFAQDFEAKNQDRFFEMFVAEQNMVGVAVGMSKMGKIPFVSTFAAFMTRAYDQIRMGAYSEANVKFVGSHSGVSIGEDGPSQMGLEDFSMFRTVFGSVVLCPADANSTAKLVREMAGCEGIVYLRTARPATEVIYGPDEEFKIGGSKILRRSNKDKVTVVATGLTVLETIRAADDLSKKGVSIRVIDAYSLKPIDEATLKKCARETGNLLITVEDHFVQGGLGDAVLEVFATDARVKIFKLAVSKMPGSATPEEQYKYEGIDSGSIVKKVLEVLG